MFFSPWGLTGHKDTVITAGARARRGQATLSTNNAGLKIRRACVSSIVRVARLAMARPGGKDGRAVASTSLKPKRLMRPLRPRGAGLPAFGFADIERQGWLAARLAK